MLLKTFQLTVKNLQTVARIVSTESYSVVFTQNYSRWAPRKVKAIVNEDELFDVTVENPTPTPPTVKPVKTVKPKLPKSNIKDTKECNEDMGNRIYTKLQENEKLMSSIMMSIKSKKKRQKNEQILLEGKRLIQDAIEAGVEMETLIFSRQEDINDMPIPKNVKMYKVTYRSIQLWSTLTTPPGIMGIFKKPKPIKESLKSLPITVICDNVRDPGNMGSILRAAAGVGCERVILTKGCVDFWDSKVVRSATGAHFRIPIHGSMIWEDILPLLKDTAHVYFADNNADSYTEDEIQDEKDEIEEVHRDMEESKTAKKYKSRKGNENSVINLNEFPVVPYFAVDYADREVILIVGGETEGLSVGSYELIKSRQGLRVNIPLDNGVESLNSGMALGIIAFEVKRQFLNLKNKLNQLAQ